MCYPTIRIDLYLSIANNYSPTYCSKSKRIESARHLTTRTLRLAIHFILCLPISFSLFLLLMLGQAIFRPLYLNHSFLFLPMRKLTVEPLRRLNSNYCSDQSGFKFMAPSNASMTYDVAWPAAYEEINIGTVLHWSPVWKFEQNYKRRLQYMMHSTSVTSWCSSNIRCRVAADVVLF